METRWLEQTEADVPQHDDWLSPSEAVELRRMRFAKRRADWRLGRWTAKRAAVAFMKLPENPQALREIEVRPAPSGAPELFVAGGHAAASISISHCAGIAVCAIATGGVTLGCDLELIEPRSDNFVADYFTASEQAFIACAPAADRPQLSTLLWSAKESALKALRQGLRLDTRCVSVSVGLKTDDEPDPDQSTQARELWRPLQVRYEERFIPGTARPEIFHGWWRSAGSLVRTLVAIPAPVAPTPLILAA